MVNQKINFKGKADAVPNTEETVRYRFGFLDHLGISREGAEPQLSGGLDNPIQRRYKV